MSGFRRRHACRGIRKVRIEGDCRQHRPPAGDFLRRRRPPAGGGFTRSGPAPAQDEFHSARALRRLGRDSGTDATREAQCLKKLRYNARRPKLSWISFVRSAMTKLETKGPRSASGVPFFPVSSVTLPQLQSCNRRARADGRRCPVRESSPEFP